ncbi:PLP-dependent aminotransferase family protein [Streptomyces sp. NRRL S-241]|uniref:aminotransferase-like domain-containing protein n=1 Tax=Streptomyces sp. NRRL S-241 TaxID=1463896 RepID=UPI000998454A|nr:PLP-dependent aminotransferase family protein [Streptomyces sp. NRRL S-241]
MALHGPQPHAQAPTRLRTTDPLRVDELHGSLSDPVLGSMTLLNEITGRYPDAVSFAAGRPYEKFYDPGQLHTYLERFTCYLQEDLGRTPAQVRTALFQYGHTKGLLTELLVQNLAVDEGITADPDAIVVTTGCQEAMILLLRALRTDDRDVILAPAPTYVGFLGAARLMDMPVRPVKEGAGGIDVDDLVTQIRAARSSGLRPRACYVVPDFANPSGLSMDLESRKRLLEAAATEGILLIEDNPYSLFNAGAERLPTLKALDRRKNVVYVGSFAKTVFPGARVGYVVADQPVEGVAAGEGPLLADQLAKLKSMLTLNTSTISQAVIGGKLLENAGNMASATRREAEVYARNLQAVLDGLRRHFPHPDSQVSWNIPGGGMFAVVTLPFETDDAMLEYSAAHFGVLWTPMRHFYAGTGGTHQIRLSFSVLTSEQIDLGLSRLAALVHDRTAGR